MTILFYHLLKNLSSPDLGILLKDVCMAFDNVCPMIKSSDQFKFFQILNKKKNGLIEYEELLDFYYDYLPKKSKRDRDEEDERRLEEQKRQERSKKKKALMQQPPPQEQKPDDTAKPADFGLGGFMTMIVLCNKLKAQKKSLEKFMNEIGVADNLKMYSKDQFRALAQKYMYARSDAVSDQIYDEFDKKRDGFIKRENMLNVLEKLYNKEFTEPPPPPKTNSKGGKGAKVQ